MSATKDKAPPNGGAPDNATALEKAFAYEQEIADEAAKLREGNNSLTPELFMQLWPLLRRPIPEGFITTTKAVKGKPYESTGIKSVQVCIDRMDNVLSPLWWWEKVHYEDDGKRAQVTICVGSDRENALVVRKSQGGVNQASTVGNLYKGSYTNAAKRAFAMVGVGHEVYLGATDLDPDVSEDAAKAQESGGGAAEPEKLSLERANRLHGIVKDAGLDDHLLNKLRSMGAKALTDLTERQGMSIYEWVQESVDRAAATDGEGS